MNKEDVFQKLSALKPQLCQKYPITYLGIFGSVVRQEHQPGSDIDILVDFDLERQPLSMTSFLGLIDSLETHLGQKVDLVTRQGLHPLLKQKILSEVEEV